MPRVKTQPMHLSHRAAAWDRAENQGASSSSSSSSVQKTPFAHKNPRSMNTPFALPELRSTLVQHTDGPTLRSALVSRGFPEATAERAARVKAYGESAARRSYKKARETGYDNLTYDNQTGFEEVLRNSYDRRHREDPTTTSSIMQRLEHDHYKAETPGYRDAYRANKAAREHAAMPRRIISRARNQQLRGWE